MTNWLKHSIAWDRLLSPMKPAPSDVSHYQKLVGQGPVMMMGVTQELYPAFNDLTAFDRDEAMIARVWLGDTETKRVIKKDWTDIEFDTAPNFAGIIGDCAVPMLADTVNMLLFQEKCFNWLKPGGVFVQRLFERPTTPYTRADLLAVMSKPAAINFHAFKWMLCMVLAEESGYRVKDTDRFTLFNELCSDRDQLAATTGWSRDSIDTMDLYIDGKNTIAFCNREEYLSTIPENAVDIQFITMTDYDLAENCPIMSWRRP